SMPGSAKLRAMFLRSRLLRLATIAAVHRFAGWQWVRLAWQSAARVVTGGLLAALLAACGSAWNDPYPAAEAGKNILYSAFTNRPKHLDPVQSYAEDEATFLYQIYE